MRIKILQLHQFHTQEFIIFKFHGNASEYFGIWIVNILLTIITLSLYAPWAKVRRLRYFYGNTEFLNAALILQGFQPRF